MPLPRPAVASNTPQEVRKLLKLLDGRIDQANVAERQRLLEAVTYLFQHVEARMGRQSGAHREVRDTFDLFDSLFVRLCNGLDGAALVVLAEALAPTATAPLATLNMLARHENATVATPILARSAALSGDDLAVLAATVGTAHLRAICTRARIDTPLAAIIVARDDTTATQQLLTNPGVAFAVPDFRDALQRAVADTRGRVDLRQPVDIFDFAGRRSGRCMTRDISPRGIKIELAGGGRPPDSFVLELPGIGGIRLVCRYVWHRDSMVGAMLQEPLFEQLDAQQSL